MIEKINSNKQEIPQDNTQALEKTFQIEPKKESPSQDETEKALSEVRENLGLPNSQEEWSDVEIIAEETTSPTEITYGISERTKNEQIFSQEFKEWFGDWQNNPESASKMVDKQGYPMIVYHGTASDIKEFDIKKTSSHFLGKGFYFTEDPTLASSYAKGKGNNEQEGENVMPVFLNIRKPLILDLDHDYERSLSLIHEGRSNPQGFTDKLKAEGYDGIICNMKAGHKIAALEIVAFSPEQIKSSLGNDGTFSKGSKEITK